MAKARRNSGHPGTRGSSARDEGGLERRLAGAGATALETDPLTGLAAELRTVQPFAAVKAYACPGCGHEIAPGVGHLVVVPLGAASERRHWHNGCWTHRHRRPTGR